MSDAGSIQPSPISQAPPQTQKAEKSGVVEIIDAPKEVKPNQKVPGEVLRIEQNGQITIKTKNGTIRVQPEEALNIKNGAPIELSIDPSGAKAQLKAIQSFSAIDALAVPADRPVISTQNGAVKLETLAQSGATIPLELFPPSQLSTLTQPYVENIVASLPQLTSSFLPILPNVQIDLNKIDIEISLRQNQTVPPVLISNKAEPLQQTKEAIETRLQPIIESIPFKSIASYLISNPLQKPLGIPKDIQESNEQTIIKDANIIQTHSPLLSIGSSTETEDILTKTIGETKATLIGLTPEKQHPVFKINGEDTFYTLSTPIKDTPIGTQITLEADKISRVSILDAPIPLSISTLPPISQSTYLTPALWDVLQEISTTLIQNAPQVAQSVHTSIPNPSTPSQLGGAALFFLAAVRSGDVQNWLGDKAIETLRNLGKGDLITRLNQEFSGLSRANTDSSGSDWRLMNLPLMWQNDIHRAVVHYRKEERQQNETNEGGSQTRFVMDLSLTQIGKLQLDGLYQDSPVKGKRLDLVLRTEQGFSQNMKAEMRRLYKDALDETNITGELSFQDTPEHWVHITPTSENQYERDV